MLEFVKEYKLPKLQGEIIVINDNKLLYNHIHEKLEKAGNDANNSGGMVTKIKELIKQYRLNSNSNL